VTVMWVRDLLQLPPGVKTLVAVMLWPALWAGALFLIALAGDLRRQRHERVYARARSQPRPTTWG